MTTFSDIKSRVQTRIIDLPQAVQTELPFLINDAIRSAQRRYNFRAMEQVQTFTTTSGSVSLGSLSRFKEYKDKGPYLLRQRSVAKRFLTALEPDARMAVLSDADLPDEPQFIINTIGNDGSTTLTIAPYPDTNSDWDDGNYRIVVPYYAYTAKLVANGDTNWFTENAEDYIISQATARGFQLDWDYESMALWLQDAEKLFQEVKKADKMQRLSSVDTLVPMHEGALQPQVRR